MNKSSINPMPTFFDRYINLVKEDNLMDAFQQYQHLCDPETMAKIEALGDRVYAPNKWTTKDLIQHIIDNERVQSYRALRFARNDQTILPGYDEGLFASSAQPQGRSLNAMAEEFHLLRASNILFYKDLSDEALSRKGICFNIEMSVLALGFVLIGHQIHHLNVLKERYFPLLS